jgi:transposase
VNTTLTTEHTAKAEDLYVAFELSKETWKLAFSEGSRRPPRVVTVPGRDLEAVEREVAKGKRRFGLAEDAIVHSCYEAGRDGFWIHRALQALGYDSIIVDAASIEMNRRKRQAKTDRLDAQKLVTQLVRYHGGETRVWSVLRVPKVEAEDARHLHRELDQLKAERREHRMRIQSLLFTHGVDLSVRRTFLADLEQARTWDDEPLPETLRARLLREHRRLGAVEAELREVRKERKQLLETSKSKPVEKTKLMAQLCGIGIDSAWVFVMEFFGWRQFRNRREVAAAAGLTPTPFSSGQSPREQGVSKAGNVRIRTLAVELAWSWLRHQPDSKLTKWFNERFADGGRRMRKVGIVAVARRLIIDLWRFIEFGVVPEGARLKVS